VALPELTPEQRQANLEKAAASRRERAEVKNRLKHFSESRRVRGLGANQIASLEREFGTRD
jgi:hypothetical protein